MSNLGQEIRYILAHTRLWFCWWDLVALIVLLAVIALLIYKIKKMKDEKERLEDELSSLNAEVLVPKTAGREQTGESIVTE